MRAERTNPRHPERGVVIIWTALFLMVMLGFVALGIDVAKLTATRTQLQNAADAAALAGASAIDMTTGELMPDTATARAQGIASLNDAFVVGPKSITLATGDITFPAANQVRVTVRRDAGSGGSMITHVAQVLGIKEIAVQATATAVVEPAGSVCDRILPMGAIEVPGTPFLTGCAHTYNLKTGAQDINKPGNFQLLDFPVCGEGPCQGMQGGSAEVRCEVANGYSCCVGIGDYVDTKPGNSVGPFVDGLKDRWDRDTDRREGICYEEYTGKGDRIVVVPIFEEWDPNGSKPVRIARFSAFFLQRRPSMGGQNAGIMGQFLNIVVPGEPGTGPATGTAYLLRLVE